MRCSLYPFLRSHKSATEVSQLKRPTSLNMSFRVRALGQCCCHQFPRGLPYSTGGSTTVALVEAHRSTACPHERDALNHSIHFTSTEPWCLQYPIAFCERLPSSCYSSVNNPKPDRRRREQQGARAEQYHFLRTQRNATAHATDTAATPVAAPTRRVEAEAPNSVDSLH